MEKQTFQYYIDRYIDGNIAQKEWTELQSVLRKPEYAHLLDDIIDNQLADATSDAGNEIYNPVTERIMAEVFKQISESKKQTNKHRYLNISRRVWQIAALLIILLGMGVFFWQKYSVTKDSSLAMQQNDIAPGHEGAVLTLENGEQILLDTIKNGRINIQAGVTAKVEKGKLRYEGGGERTVYNTLTTPKGRKYQLILQDGTQIWLNAASSVKYPTTFLGNDRTLAFKGEAFFDVAEDKMKPFKISVNDKAVIEVFGTRFTVSAYENERATQVTLLEGSVSVKGQKSKSSVVLKPGYQATLDNKSELLTQNSVNINETTAWKSSVFVMHNMEVEAMMRKIARWYDVEVIYPEGVPDAHFTGDIPDSMSLNNVIEVLKLSGIKCEIDNRKLIVFK